jgi:hypothetical protein
MADAQAVFSDFLPQLVWRNRRRIPIRRFARFGINAPLRVIGGGEDQAEGYKFANAILSSRSISNAQLDP